MLHLFINNLHSSSTSKSDLSSQPSHLSYLYNVPRISQESVTAEDRLYHCSCSNYRGNPALHFSLVLLSLSL